MTPKKEKCGLGAYAPKNPVFQREGFSFVWIGESQSEKDILVYKTEYLFPCFMR